MFSIRTDTKRDYIELPHLYVDSDCLCAGSTLAQKGLYNDYINLDTKESYNNYAPMNYLSTVDYSQRTSYVKIS